MITFLSRQGQHPTHLFQKEGVSFDSNVGQSKAPILVAVLQLVRLQPLVPAPEDELPQTRFNLLSVLVRERQNTSGNLSQLCPKFASEFVDR